LEQRPDSAGELAGHGPENETIIGRLPISLQMSRGKIARFALICLAVMAFTVWLNSMSIGDWTLWVGGFFAILFLFFGIMILKPGRLQIEQQGFGISTLWRRKPDLIPWNYVEGFSVMRIGMKSVVAFQFSEASGRRRMPGGNALPDTFGMEVAELAGILNACREHFSSEKLSMSGTDGPSEAGEPREDA
jgi:hypothetical protein